MPPPKTTKRRTLKKKIAKSKSKSKAKAKKSNTVTLPPRQQKGKKEPVITEKDRLVVSQKLARDRQLVIDELMAMNAEQTLIIARQRAALKLYNAASTQQPGAGG